MIVHRESVSVNDLSMNASFLLLFTVLVKEGINDTVLLCHYVLQCGMYCACTAPFQVAT